MHLGARGLLDVAVERCVGEYAVLEVRRKTLLLLFVALHEARVN